VPGGHVNDKVVEFAPIGLFDELFESVRSHRTAPKHGAVFVDEETNRKEFHAVALYRDNEVSAVNFVHK